jgi:hypothetical protein
MDTDTSQAIEAVRGDLREVESSLRADIRQVETTLDARIQRVEETLRTDMRHMEAALGERIDDARRHAGVLFESVRDDVRIVAEGVVSIQHQVSALTTKVDSLRPRGDER